MTTPGEDVPSMPELPTELPSLELFARRLAAGPRRPSAGAAAALAVALAADLLAQVAQRTPAWEGHGGILAQADVVRERAIAGAGHVAVAYHGLVESLDAAVANPANPPEGTDLGEQLAGAADVLLEIAETASDCTALAVVVAQFGDTVVRVDASAAAILAASAAEMACHLVEVNLLASAEGERTDRARLLARTATANRSAAARLTR
jgi:formiminotetrahydrofolate cyclodeaminase